LNLVLTDYICTFSCHTTVNQYTMPLITSTDLKKFLSQFGERPIEEVIIDEIPIVNPHDLPMMVDLIKDQIPSSWQEIIEREVVVFCNYLEKEKFRGKPAEIAAKYLIGQLTRSDAPESSYPTAIKLFFMRLAWETIKKTGPQNDAPDAQETVSQGLNTPPPSNSPVDPLKDTHDENTNSGPVLEDTTPKRKMRISWHLIAFGIQLLFGVGFYIIQCLVMATPENIIPDSPFQWGAALAIVLFPTACTIPFLLFALIYYLIKKRFLLWVYCVGLAISVIYFTLAVSGMKKWSEDQKKAGLSEIGTKASGKVKGPSTTAAWPDEKVKIQPPMQNPAKQEGKNSLNVDISQEQRPLFTRSEFAAKFKKAYPSYADDEDSLLVERVLAKYPEYKEFVKEQYRNRYITLYYPCTWELNELPMMGKSVLYNVSISKPGERPRIGFSISGSKDPGGFYTLNQIDNSVKTKISSLLKKQRNLTFEYLTSSWGKFLGYQARFHDYSICDSKDYRVSGQMIVFRTGGQIVIIQREGQPKDNFIQETRPIIESLGFYE